MRRPTIVILCNALDDATRAHRRIHTDSPAASRKVFMLCKALRKAGVAAYAISLGRGKPDRSWSYFKSNVRRVDGVPVIYSPFSHLPIFSELTSLFGLLCIVFRLSRTAQKAIIFYNRLVAYVPAALLASVLGFRCILDLEDGEVSLQEGGGSLRSKIRQMLARFFDRCCHAGALLACSALSSMTRIRPTQCYYGTVAQADAITHWQTKDISILLSGTVDDSTGAHLLLQAIAELRLRNAEWSHQLRFEITGNGDRIKDFKRIAGDKGSAQVIVHGRLNNSEYLRVLHRCDVGLALKPINGALANTTFPSKVIEFADAGLLVVSTDISDVRLVLGDGALYLTANAPEQIIRHLQSIVENRAYAQKTALAGTAAVVARCAQNNAGRNVAQFALGSF